MRRAFILVPMLFSVASAQESASEIAADALDIYAHDTYRIDTLVFPFKERIEYEPVSRHGPLQPLAPLHS